MALLFFADCSNDFTSIAIEYITFLCTWILKNHGFLFVVEESIIEEIENFSRLEQNIVSSANMQVNK